MIEEPKEEESIHYERGSRSNAQVKGSSDEVAGEISNVSHNEKNLLEPLYPNVSSYINELLSIRDLFTQDANQAGEETASFHINNLLCQAGELTQLMDGV